MEKMNVERGEKEVFLLRSRKMQMMNSEMIEMSVIRSHGRRNPDMFLQMPTNSKKQVRMVLMKTNRRRE